MWGQDGWILAKFFFCVFMDRDEVEVHKLAKKRTRPISSHLDWTSLVNKGYGIWKKMLFSCGTQWVTKHHVSHSGSQPQDRIWFKLPTHTASHLTKMWGGSVAEWFEILNSWVQVYSECQLMLFLEAQVQLLGYACKQPTDLPVGILNLAMFLWIFIYHFLFTLVLN